jgi:hypothetical protein
VENARRRIELLYLSTKKDGLGGPSSGCRSVSVEGWEERGRREREDEEAMAADGGAVVGVFGQD